MILGHLKRTTDAVAALDRARECGKPLHLVKVQMTYALLRASEPLEALARDTLREARQASPRAPNEMSGRLFESHWREVRALEGRLGMMVSPLP
jgi:hypothetical protein